MMDTDQIDRMRRELEREATALLLAGGVARDVAVMAVRRPHDYPDIVATSDDRAAYLLGALWALYEVENTGRR